MYIGEIIKKYRNENNEMSLRTFASRTSLSHSYIDALEKIYDKRTGKPIAVTVDAAKEIANAMQMSIERLLSMLDDTQEFVINSNANTNKLPILGTVKAGYDYLANEEVIGYYDSEEYDSENHFVLRITGDSMFPFTDGDTVIVRKQKNFESGKTCVVRVNGDEATVKDVIKINNGIRLVARNPNYPPREYTKEEIEQLPVEIIGVVVEGKLKGMFK